MQSRPRLKTAVLISCGLAGWVLISVFTGTWCWFQAMIGVPCPGCGSTRAAVALLQGNLSEALFWHPLIIVSLILLPYLAVRSLFIKRKPFVAVEKFIILGACALYLIVFIVRMIMFFPHTPPMDMNDTTVLRQSLRLFGVVY